MCMFSWFPIKRKAKQAITCYKFLLVPDNYPENTDCFGNTYERDANGNVLLLAPFRWKHYSLWEKTSKQTITRKFNFNLFETNRAQWKVDRGYHSFVNIDECLEFIHTDDWQDEIGYKRVIVRCTIPMGAEYITGRWNVRRHDWSQPRNYVSDTLVVEEVIY